MCEVQHFCLRHVQDISPGHLAPLQEREHVYLDHGRGARTHGREGEGKREGGADSDTHTDTEM